MVGVVGVRAVPLPGDRGAGITRPPFGGRWASPGAEIRHGLGVTATRPAGCVLDGLLLVGAEGSTQPTPKNVMATVSGGPSEKIHSDFSLMDNTPAELIDVSTP